MHLLRVNTVANNTRGINIRLLMNIHHIHVPWELSFALSFINLVNDRRSKLTEIPGCEKRVTYRHSLTRRFAFRMR